MATYEAKKYAFDGGSITSNTIETTSVKPGTIDSTEFGHLNGLAQDVTTGLADKLSLSSGGTIAANTTLANTVQLGFGTNGNGNYIYDGKFRDAGTVPWRFEAGSNSYVSINGANGEVISNSTSNYNVCKLTDVGIKVFSNDATNANTVFLTQAGEGRFTSEVTAYYTSDERLKENISTIENALDKVNCIRGVEFDWKADHIKKRGGEDGFFVRKHDVGIVAQDVAKVCPEVVAEREDGTLGVKYEKLIGLLVQAINELSAKVNHDNR